MFQTTIKVVVKQIYKKKINRDSYKYNNLHSNQYYY